MLSQVLHRLKTSLTTASPARLSRISLLAPLLLGPVAAYGAQASLSNLGRGCWRLKSTYNSMGLQNRLQLQEGEAPGSEGMGKANQAPSFGDNTVGYNGIPRLGTFQISPLSRLTMAFERQDRPVVQRLNLLDENYQTEGILEVAQTLEAGQAKITLRFHAIPGREAVVRPAVLAESDFLIFFQRSWSQDEGAKRGPSLPGTP